MFRIIYLFTICFSLLKHGSAQQYGSFKDPRDGKVYKTVKIGEQAWMAENLNTDRFRNGDKIPEAKTKEEWIKAGENQKPAWCYYNNDPENGKKYGKLYNWYAVNDPRGLAPEGWHVSNEDDWNLLTNYLGGQSVSGKKMKYDKGWDIGNGTNESGFSGLPGGRRDLNKIGNNPPFFLINEVGWWWSSTINNLEPDRACSRTLDSESDSLYPSCSFSKGEGLSVRCVKN